MPIFFMLSRIEYVATEMFIGYPFSNRAVRSLGWEAF